MTPNEINIAIAEACGWTITPPSAGYQAATITDPHGRFWPSRVWMPDYYNDLNACHEAEKAIRAANQFHYVQYPRLLFEVVTGIKWSGDLGYFAFAYINATAPQRCEAILRTLGKWKD